ncbi:hypothetical protein HWV62_19869 [Athelia sp. TMB]|nr:hypothetical protein HWV62_19869 [Athelia sp. TMB]
MSEAYMTEDFDLPRWQTQDSSSQSIASPPHPPSTYGSQYPPPPPPAARLQSQAASQAPPSPASRQPPRISQLLEQEQGQQPAQYGLAPHSTLSRSASLGGAPSSSSRTRRHHQSDDLEGAFHSDANPASPRSGAGSLYPSSVAYHQPSSPAGDNAYTDNTAMYYSGSNTHTPKRSLTTHDSSTSSRSPATKPSLADAYAQQSQYSPTANAGFSAPYPPPPPGSYSHTHSRSHSQAKGEPMTPPLTSPYAPNTLSPSYDNNSPQARGTSVSTPNTPFPYPQHSSSPYYGSGQDMQVDAPRGRRGSGFKRVRDARDLRPVVNAQPQGRRMGADGAYLSLTTNIIDTYRICNPAFRYESTHNPRRVLTKPSKPVHNEGYDNDDYDYILYVNDWLGTEEGHKYLILDILGQGTFGQVVKCQNMKTHEIVAVKVVKNKPAYFNQSMMEVTILELLNTQCDPQDEHHILRLRDSFIHRSHLCLVFELLSSNLYELIKQNQFQGLSTQLVKVFTAQLLDAMTVLKEARLIHCDLKPENILLKSLQSPQIKVIDFGSACHERQTVYTYIQSRFYRSPEVLLGIPYTASIDMWSLGCIAVELFLGLPLFPGTSEYNQITRIVEMVGMPPTYMLDMGKQTHQFFDSYIDHYGQKKYRLKTLEQYSREHNTNEQPGKQYFKATSLPEIVNTAPMPTFKSSSRQGHEMEKELNNRASFIDFCEGLLNLNPIQRWSPQQARQHPFITGEKFVRPFTPPQPQQQGQGTQSPSTTTTTSSPAADPKRPYGGLVPSQPKGTRAYQDAASYNQHLAQHQAYTAQAQAATQAANNAFRNPYITGQQGSSQPQQPASYTGSQDANNAAYSAQPPQQHPSPASQMPNPSTQQYASHTSGGGSNSLTIAPNMVPAPPSNTYYNNSRHRANTINQMDTVPPALARLQHMNQDVIAGRNALTPVLNRDDAMREWERRQTGKPPAAQPYPQLEYLQQQAELAGSGLTNWAQQQSAAAASGRYQPGTKLSHSYAPTIVVDEDRAGGPMATLRGRPDAGSAYASAAIASPPQAYATGAGTGTRYAGGYSQQPQANTSPFDTIDRRTDIGSVYVPMQPDQYQSYSAGSSQVAGSRNAAPPVPGAAQSFYGASVAGIAAQGQQPSSAQRNPFTGANPPQSAQEGSRSSGMDVWPR